ncbi:hypothetical protein B0G71_3852 [Paraburkholderia sp. BL27I4N3]|nr:hypothetical protein B0G71_3852 [Paraburkholderia sp. BL27I4N3]
MRKCKEHMVIKLTRLQSSRLVTLTFVARGNAAKEISRGWKLARRGLTRRRP